MPLVTTVGLEWTVLTWNVQGTEPTDIAHVASVIGAESPDVVVLQEARRDQAAQLATRLSMSSAWAEKHHPLRPFCPSTAEGAAILTPHSLDAADHTVVSDEDSRRSYRRRILQWATIQRDDSSGYRVYNAHLSPHDLSAERMNEAARISEIVAMHGDAPPAIVAGDLNDQNDPGLIDALPGVEHVASPVTNPSEHPTQSLDHVLLPLDAREVSVSAPAGGADWAELSDHLPVTVRFTLDWVRGDFVS